MNRLPRGRHSLTREQVAGDQRDRIHRALAEAMAAKGFVATSVADVIAGAGVSRATFYELYTSKTDCFMSAFEAAAEQVMAAMATADDPLRVYLDMLASEPEIARLFMLEVYAAGPDALARRQQILDRFVGFVEAEDAFTAQALVAATSMLVTGRLAANDPDGIRALHGPLTELAGRML